MSWFSRHKMNRLQEDRKTVSPPTDSSVSNPFFELGKMMCKNEIQHSDDVKFLLDQFERVKYAAEYGVKLSEDMHEDASESFRVLAIADNVLKKYGRLPADDKPISPIRYSDLP